MLSALDDCMNFSHNIALMYEFTINSSLSKICFRNIYDNGLLIQLLFFWTLSIVLFLFKTQRFGDWILSPSSGGTYSVAPNRQS
jgi:hypothetical protein